MVQKRTAIYFKDSITGKESVKDWLMSLKDKMAKAKIMTRISRAESGNFGNNRSLGNGVFELKIDFGPGYRVYYALDGNEIILLLFGGDKTTQEKDIDRAKLNWSVYKTGG